MWIIYALVAVLVVQTFRLMREQGRTCSLREENASLRFDLLEAGRERGGEGE